MHVMKMTYEEVLLARNQPVIFTEMVKKNDGFLNTVAWQLSWKSKHYIPIDDLKSAMYEAIWQAIESYEPGQGKKQSFKAYFFMIAKRRAMDLDRWYGKERHNLIYTALPFEAPRYRDENDIKLGDTLPISLEFVDDSTERKILRKEIPWIIQNELRPICSKLEWECITLLAEGYDYKEIAEKVNRTKKGVDNAIQRARGKLNLFRRELFDLVS